MTLNDVFADFIGHRLAGNAYTDSERDKRDLMRNNLLNSLDDVQKAMFEQYEEFKSCLDGRCEFTNYGRGFVDGIRLAGGY